MTTLIEIMRDIRAISDEGMAEAEKLIAWMQEHEQQLDGLRKGTHKILARQPTEPMIAAGLNVTYPSCDRVFAAMWDAAP